MSERLTRRTPSISIVQPPQSTYVKIPLVPPPPQTFIQKTFFVQPTSAVFSQINPIISFVGQAEQDLLSAYQKVSFPKYEQVFGKRGRKQMAPERYTLDYEKKKTEVADALANKPDVKKIALKNQTAAMKKRKNEKEDFERCKNAVNELKKRL